MKNIFADSVRAVVQHVSIPMMLVLVACGGHDAHPAADLAGTVSGLTASGLILADGNRTLSVSPNAQSFDFGNVLVAGQTYAVTVQTAPNGQVCSVVNGSGTATTANVANVVVTCASAAHHLGGTITGLTAGSLVLANGSDTLTVDAGADTFDMSVEVVTGSSYSVTVQTQPSGLACTVGNGTGAMPSSDVISVTVTCTDQPFTLGGTITGLTGAGLVIANGNDSLAVDVSATQFMMPTALTVGSSYALTVQSQPNGLSCTFSTGQGVGASSGTMPAANVTDVALVCAPQSYALGGTVSGLSSGTLVLANGADTITVSANGPFQLPASVAAGTSYSVTVQTQPSGLTCTPSNNTGAMPAAAVNNVSVTCAITTYTVGGTISGLSTPGLQLQNNGADTLVIVANATQFTMPAPVASGATYNITVSSQPGGQTCSVTNGSGTVGAADVTNVAITCPRQVSFTTPGAGNWTVPAGITSVTLVATGGGGGSGDLPAAPPLETGGNGGVVTVTLTVNPGDAFDVIVGGGGLRGVGAFRGGGGGGSSNVALNSTTIVVAGGGGGGGGGPGNGGAGGNGAGGGAGADGTAGGAGGANPGGQPGAAGSGGTAGGAGATAGGSGTGGAGGSSAGAGGSGTGAGVGGVGAPTGGGGGGGGYGGGGGGYATSTGGGGGGGGSLGPAGSQFTVSSDGGSSGGGGAQNGGNGSVVITW